MEEGRSMTPWGQAIAMLLKQANCSRAKAAQRHVAPYSAFSQWKTSRQGPSVAVLDRLLRGLGLTWHDWAQTYESIPPTHRAPSESIRRDGTPNLYLHPSPHFGL